MFPFSSKFPNSVPRTEPRTERLEWTEMQLFLHILPFHHPPLPHHNGRFNPPQSEATLLGHWLKCATQAIMSHALKLQVFVSNVWLQDVE